MKSNYRKEYNKYLKKLRKRMEFEREKERIITAGKSHSLRPKSPEIFSTQHSNMNIN